jgi:8-oxo-dGTP pyrophosphatase MutT (NUDIX family)
MKPDMPTSLEQAAGVVLFRMTKKSREYLLLLHPDAYNSRVGRRDMEYWNFPKGRKEEGETDEKTMRRELAEETGITRIRMVPGFESTERYIVRRNGMQKQKRVIFFLAQTKQKQIRLSPEHRAYEWLGYGEARQRLTYSNGKSILTKAEAFLSTHKNQNTP